MLGAIVTSYRTSLRLKISVPVTLALLLTVGVLMLVSDAILGATIERSAIDSAQQIGVLLADERNVAGDIAGGTTGALESRLRAVRRSVRDVVAIAAYARRDGCPGFTRVQQSSALPAEAFALPPALAENAPLSSAVDARTSAGRPLLVVTVPVTDAPIHDAGTESAAEPRGNRIGSIVVAYSLHDASVRKWQYQLVLLTLAAALLLFVLSLSSRLTSRVLRPLRSVLRAMARLADGHSGERVEVFDRDEIGELSRHFNAMAAQLEANRAEIERYAAELEDRVEQRTAELSRANEELRTLDLAKDAFLSNISHEMRTPLTSILASTEILADYVDEDPATRAEFVEIIHQEAQRLASIINSVLDLVQLEAESARIERSDVDLAPLLSDVVAAFEPRARKRSVQLGLRILRERLPVHCDPDRIASVCNHLLDNALKFSPAGATVDVEATVDGGDCVIRFRDEGPGVDPAQVGRIFGKFGQGGTILTNKPQGVGLGLAISSRIAKAHDGSLSYEALPGWGATFVLRLPLLADDAAGVGQRDASASATARATIA